MGHVCTHNDIPDGSRPDGKDPGEHPIVAVIAVIAIFVAILLITWARVAVHGTEDIEAALIESDTSDTRIEPKPDKEREIDEAVTANRFATGFSP
jgi:hypothetical protein